MFMYVSLQSEFSGRPFDTWGGQGYGFLHDQTFSTLYAQLKRAIFQTLSKSNNLSQLSNTKQFFSLFISFDSWHTISEGDTTLTCTFHLDF